MNIERAQKHVNLYRCGVLSGTELALSWLENACERPFDELGVRLSFEAMADEEQDHVRRLVATVRAKGYLTIPYIGTGESVIIREDDLTHCLSDACAAVDDRE
jgi:hypothetical protein